MASPAQLVIEAFETRYRSTPDVVQAQDVARAPRRGLGAQSRRTPPSLFGKLEASAPVDDGTARKLAAILGLERLRARRSAAIAVWPRPRSLIYGTVPLGSGLSSSAARAENEFIGLPSGIMAQYVSVFGRRNAALLTDCLSFASEPVELPNDAAIVAVNLMVKHELAQSAYRKLVERGA